MIIHFSASARNISKDIHKYRKILNVVRRMGHSIAHDWIETSVFRKESGGGEWNLQEIVQEAEAGIAMAELVIVEASDSSTFGVGYELAVALLQGKKPILVLAEKRHAANSYASALQNDLITVRIYNSDAEMEQQVEAFVRENTYKTKDLRFNFVVDRQIYNYLRSKSFKTGKTKAEVVRDLLMEDMSRH